MPRPARVVVLFLAAHLLILAALPPEQSSEATAGSAGSMRQVVGNEKIQIYVTGTTEVYDEGGEIRKRVDVHVILKNIEPGARAFNPFFARVIDSNGEEEKAHPLFGTVMPIRIPPDDILAGTLAFPVPPDVELSSLVWEEFDGSRLEVDLTESRSPPEPTPASGWVLLSNKGMMLSDGRTELKIEEELFSESPPRYYAVDISIRNVGDSSLIQYNPGFAFVKDQEGYLYPAALQHLDLLNDPLGRGELEQGGEVRGQILFLLPDTASRVMLIYDERLGRGSYFAVPEFPYQATILIGAAGAGLALVLARLRPAAHAGKGRTFVDGVRGQRVPR